MKLNFGGKKGTGVIIVIVLLLAAVVVGLLGVQQRQVTSPDAQVPPSSEKVIACGWETAQNANLTLVDAEGNILAGPVDVSEKTGHSFTIDSEIAKDPVFCQLSDPTSGPQCTKISDPIICAPDPTATPTPVIGDCFDSCDEDEILPRCGEGLQCLHNDDGSKTCQPIDPERCPIATGSPTPTSSPTTTPSPTITPTVGPTITPGGPSLTPSPTPSSSPTPTSSPTPSATNTPTATPTTCPIPEAVKSIALVCTESPGKCSWDASNGADYYLVTIKDEKTGKPIAGYNPNKRVTETEVEFTLEAGINYVCIVEAVDETCGGSPAEKSSSCSIEEPTATPVPDIACNEGPNTCDPNNDLCEGDMTCKDINASDPDKNTDYRCVINESCGNPNGGDACWCNEPTGTPSPTDTVVVEATNTPIPTATPAEPILPETGLAGTTAWIALVFAIIGGAAILFGIAF